MSVVVVAMLLAVATLVWPRAYVLAAERAGLALSVGAGRTPGVSVVGEREVVPGPASLPALVARIWNEDPAELVRAWRLRRKPDNLLADALQLLSGIAPGLAAGLPPGRAVEVAVAAVVTEADLARARIGQRQRVALAGVGTESWRVWSVVRRLPGGRGSAAPGPAAGAGVKSDGRPPEVASLGADLLRAGEGAQPVSRVWFDWSVRTGSAELAFVAAAWSLSETTGAPLVAAVERGVRGLRDAGRRRGKVAAAVAGPQATVTVLTVLPLTGPLFGLACGIDPVTLYAGSPLSMLAALVGLGLVWAGRRWCAGLVRSAVRR